MRDVWATPRPVPSRLVPVAAGAALIVLALPVFAAAGWPLRGWALGAILWLCAQALGLLATVIGQHRANIINVRLDTRDSRFHTNMIDVEVHDVQQLMRLLAALRALDAVNAVERV